MDEHEANPGNTLRARWTQLTALGLVMIGLAPFLMLAGALLWGLDLGDAAAFLLPFVIVPWVAAFLVWRFGTWAKIVAIVVSLAGLATLYWTAFGLTYPSSFFEFVPGLLVVPGAIIAIVGAIAGMVANRRGHVVAGREGGERRAIGIVVAVVGVLAVVSAVLTVSSRSNVSTADAAVQVDMKNFKFDQAGYSAPQGASVGIRNEDPFAHTFTIDELGIDVHLGPGDAVVVDLPTQAGTYVLYCTLHTSDPQNPSSGDMAATFTVG